MCCLIAVSGLFTTSEDAQHQVSLGVAVYTGSTVLYLTLVWGMCVIFGRTELHEDTSTCESQGASTSKPFILKGKLAPLKG